VRLRPGRFDRHHRRLGQQGVLGRDAHRLGAGRPGRHPQPGRRAGLRRSQARDNRDDLLAALRRELPDWEYEVPAGGLTLWVRAGGLSGSRLAEVGERVGVRVPSGPRFGVDGAFEGYLRLPFTVGGAVADEAAARLASAARLVESGVTGGGEASGAFVA
jgi:hypothetical protein